MRAKTEKKQPLRLSGPPLLPTVRLLYSGDDVVPDFPLFPLDREVIHIGREVAPGICLPGDPRLSRLHASLHVGPERRAVVLTDEDSTNGTCVNGAPVKEALLSDGDLLSLGDSHFIYRLEPEEGRDAPIPGLLGWAPETRRLRGLIADLAPTPLSVLLLGESGTGKEVTAAALHQGSGRGGPFLPVNCSAIPLELAESQLFGHVSGAFSGARAAAPGLFRAAEGGTLFLDEVGDLPQELQPKLLRALEERRVLPVGATASVPVDVRVISATNRDLTEAVARGAFRLDLFARLNQFTLHLPPLRARREDILALLLRALGAAARPITPHLAERLLRYDWPGNVREVLNLAGTLTVSAARDKELDLPRVEALLPLRPAPPSPPPARPAADEREEGDDAGDGAIPIPTREELFSLLSAHRGVVANVARVVRRSRKQVYRWVREHKIDLRTLRAPGAAGDEDDGEAP